MATTHPPVDLEQAPLMVLRHVLWHFGDANLGLRPSHFVERLLMLFAAADEVNFVRLRREFPEYAHAFTVIQRVEGGLDRARTIVMDAL
ncbi:hypothetical protein [Agromyces larvae]|uniref:Uncharacterized protein n=1 Tax=Agromyces larvae TaxID=2929802 RepID=A0ABY4C2C2_9MICO|nr:hypothetical protein [Agromyces larvae]UOE45513.1 hypothetical protein MTO99_07075 [Agromyces larvae]